MTENENIHPCALCGKPVLTVCGGTGEVLNYVTGDMLSCSQLAEAWADKIKGIVTPVNESEPTRG